MKRVLALLLACVFLSFPATAQDFDLGFTPYHERTDFLMTSPGSMKFGLYGFDNPAGTAMLHQPDLLFQWSDDGGFTDLNQWGLFAAHPNVGFGVVDDRTVPDTNRRTDYRLSLATGGDAGAFGVGFGWYGGDEGLDRQLTLGTLLRPSRYLSLGLMGSRSLQRADYEGVAELAVRPFGTPRLALFGELAADTDLGLDTPTWSAGAAVDVVDGPRVTSRYTHDSGHFDEAQLTAGLQFSLGRAGLQSQTHTDGDLDPQFNTDGIRLGAYDRNVQDSYLADDDTYLELDLAGSAPYQTPRLFDTRTTHYEKLNALEQAHEDPRIGGVVVDATNMAMSPGKVWEVYDALERLRAAGHTVILYAERGGMSMLHLVAAADKVVMDPYGTLSIPGYVTGSTYLADVLDRIGIGVDEFREMEYKSAFEVLSRTEMSDADREQRQALVDDFYELAQRNVADGTDLSRDDFDDLIDRGIGLRSSDLKEAGLVDELARPEDLDDAIEALDGAPADRIGPAALLPNQEPRDGQWGPRPEIGLLYAIGPTQTESGIRARALAEEIRSMRDRRNMEALVLRADSPGGDPLASDLVAEELRKTAEDMPVLVSMGDVAASGGYWISMYADEIVALPNTVTGSIGVIGGWLYNDGLSDNLHLATDHVQRGESADATFGPTLPLVGLTLPDRPLREGEREQLVGNLNALYDEFLENVAEGRDLDVEAVEEVAAGRVWTGEAALERNLVDELGSLQTTLDRARDDAGLEPDEPVQIVEGPDAPLVQLPGLLGPLGLDRLVDAPDERDRVVQYLELMTDHNGEPLAVLPFEYLVWYYQMTSESGE